MRRKHGRDGAGHGQRRAEHGDDRAEQRQPAGARATTALTTADHAQALAQTSVQYDAAARPASPSTLAERPPAPQRRRRRRPDRRGRRRPGHRRLHTAESYRRDAGASRPSPPPTPTPTQWRRGLTSRIDQVSARADGATAAALASTYIPQAIKAGHAMLGFGVGTWGGETGFAAGLSTRLRDDHTTFKASVNFNSRGQGGGGAGIGYEF